MVAISFSLQVGRQHNATLGRFLKESFVPVADCFLLLVVGAIPLSFLEIIKVRVTHEGKDRPCDDARVLSLFRHPPAMSAVGLFAEGVIRECQ